jgi:hypothetical protein
LLRTGVIRHFDRHLLFATPKQSGWRAELGPGGHGVSRDVPSLRDSLLNRTRPGTAVPGYRLCRPCGTILLRPVNGTAIGHLLALVYVISKHQRDLSVCAFVSGPDFSQAINDREIVGLYCPFSFSRGGMFFHFLNLLCARILAFCDTQSRVGAPTKQSRRDGTSRLMPCPSRTDFSRRPRRSGSLEQNGTWRDVSFLPTASRGLAWTGPSPPA